MKIILQFILFFTISFSQSLKINVIDQLDSLPLEGSNVILSNGSGFELGTSTDKNGNCTFNRLKKGTYNLTIGFIGYEDFKTEVIINDIKDYVVNCSLIIKSILIPELNIISNVNAPYKKLPGAGTVMNEAVIKQISPIGTQEILEHIPGIHAFADDGIGNSRISVGIRGLNPRRSSRVLVLEDGVPIQPALYVYPNMYYNPPVERIDGVQVIKGSGVIKYGPQTMGGVINYFTRRPNSKFGGFTNLIIGENNYKSLFAEVTGFGTENLKNAVQFLYKSGDGFRDNNGFEQYNGTYKTIYTISDKRNIYSKLGFNYENSNATYTGLTEYSFENDPKFNPKEDDNFKLFRTAIDLIETHQINDKIIKTRKLFGSYFDRRWWREGDIFTSASDTSIQIEAIAPSGPLQFKDDIIRTGNGETNLGILRTFFVMGIEQSYKIKNEIFGYKSISEIGTRVYWEKFIDNKKMGDSPDARDGIFYYEGDTFYDGFNGVYDESEEFIDTNENGEYDEGEEFTDLINTELENSVYDEGELFTDINGDGIYNQYPDIVGQSHHYETTAFSTFLSNSVKFNPNLTIKSGLRIELFEQERIDLLNGASYLDNTTFVVLPSLGFINEFSLFSIFGGIHRGYTSPSSGSLKATNFSIDSGLDLKAEKSWNKEIGIRTINPSDKTNFELSFFHIGIEDMVAAGRGGEYGVFENFGKVSSMGSELNFFLNFENYFSILPKFHISHTFLYTKIIDAELRDYNFIGTGISNLEGNELPYSPRNSVNIALEKLFSNKINIRADWKYVGEVYTEFHNIDLDNFEEGFEEAVGFGKLGIDGTIPAYNFFNLNANYQLSELIDINLSVKNVTDKIYIGSRLHSNPGQRQAFMSSGIIPGPRRQINFSIKYSF